VDQNSLLSLNLSYWLLQTVAMIVTALLIPRLKITGPLGAFITVISLAFVNSKIWDAALFFQIPNTLSTHALFLFLTNGIIFWILVKLLPGIEVQGIMPALVAPVVFTACSMIIGEYASEIDWAKVLDVVINFLEGLKTYFQEHAPTPEEPVELSRLLSFEYGKTILCTAVPL